MITRDTTHSTLERVTEDVVRRFSSLPVRPAGDLIPLPSEECVVGRARFGGSVSGVLMVAAPVGLCQEMAAGAPRTGTASGDAMSCASRTIAELANTISGGIIAALMPGQSITFSPPVAERSSYHDWVVMSCAGGTVRLSVAGRPLLTSMLLLPS